MDIANTSRSQPHRPVLVDEVAQWLKATEGGLFVDCTVGAGGHAEALLTASPSTRVIGLDRDEEILSYARSRLARFADRFRAIHSNFADLGSVLNRLGVEEVDGVLADLGVSSLQLDTAERGFSFAADAPLDMRMDRSVGETAADLLAGLNEQELADLIFEYGEERAARRIARAIVRHRLVERIGTTSQLADLVVRAVRQRGRWRIHPATRTFQALRIAVNRELDALEALIPAAVSRLNPGGRLAIISFHSLEDRIVKRVFLRESGRCICGLTGESAMPVRDPSSDILCERCGARRRVKILTRRPVRPAPDEVALNPRSRSARLRVCERIA